jgi:hypothetical protein
LLDTYLFPAMALRRCAVFLYTSPSIVGVVRVVRVVVRVCSSVCNRVCDWVGNRVCNRGCECKSAQKACDENVALHVERERCDLKVGSLCCKRVEALGEERSMSVLSLVYIQFCTLARRNIFDI